MVCVQNNNIQEAGEIGTQQSVVNALPAGQECAFYFFLFILESKNKMVCGPSSNKLCNAA